MLIDILYAVKGAKWATVACDSFVVVFHWDPAEKWRSQCFVWMSAAEIERDCCAHWAMYSMCPWLWWIVHCECTFMNVKSTFYTKCIFWKLGSQREYEYFTLIHAENKDKPECITLKLSEAQVISLQIQLDIRVRWYFQSEHFNRSFSVSQTVAPCESTCYSVGLCPFF